MSAPCSEDFQVLADRLGGIACDANPVVTLRAPWDLANWTLPVVELLMVGGAALGLAHALVLWRRHGQPAWCGLWAAMVLFVLVLEPPIYFPDEFGIGEQVGLTFVHNVFTVEFLYDRMPLYIVALYPAGMYLAHAIVERAGVFQSHGIIRGAAAVGFVHLGFYEIFDHLGPQLRWWAWSSEVESVQQRLASVPLSSMLTFATLAPTFLVGLARHFLFRDPVDRTGGQWVWRVAVVGLASVVWLPLSSIHVSVAQAVAGYDAALPAVLTWATLLAVVAVGVSAIASSRPAERLAGLAGGYPIWFGWAWLATFAVLWFSALPDLLDASGGVTAEGTPTGSVPFVVAAFVWCAWVVIRAGRAPIAAPAVASDPAEETLEVPGGAR